MILDPDKWLVHLSSLSLTKLHHVKPPNTHTQHTSPFSTTLNHLAPHRIISHHPAQPITT